MKAHVKETVLASVATHSLDQWLDAWATPELTQHARIEWSPRLTRSLGRCYPTLRLIRIASYLESAEPALLEEVVCHELAHLAARERHGDRIRPHGAEWKALMRAAGYEPRVRMPAPARLARLLPEPRRRYLYLHRCPVCRLARPARRLFHRWRCAACIASGLEGMLTVTRYPK